MTDPRNVISIEGVQPLVLPALADNSTITYDKTKANGSAQVGLAVRLVPGTDKTIELVGDGEAVWGKLLKVESDLTCSVQVGGGMTLPAGTGATLTIGAPIVGDTRTGPLEGYIRAAAAATTPTPGEVDEARLSRGAIFDASDTDNVEVLL